MKLPIYLRHYTLHLGMSTLLKAGDLPVSCYQVFNKHTGLAEVEGSILPKVFNRALMLDADMEYAVKYWDRHGKDDDHLKGIVLAEDKPKDGLITAADKAKMN